MAGRVIRGGIAALLDLIEEHRGAVEYDFRARFHLPADSIGEEMGWSEALRLLSILHDDPSSMLAAAMRKWKYPVSRAEVIAMDSYDLAYAATGSKTKHRYPRPFEVDDHTHQKRGNTTGRAIDATKAILARFARGAAV